MLSVFTQAAQAEWPRTRQCVPFVANWFRAQSRKYESIKASASLDCGSLSAYLCHGVRILRFLTLFLLSTGTALFCRPADVAPELGALDKASTAEVIVRFRHTPNENHHERVRQRGGKHKADLSLIRSGLYSLPASAIDDLALDPEVESISPDPPVHAALDNATPAAGQTSP